MRRSALGVTIELRVQPRARAGRDDDRFGPSGRQVLAAQQGRAFGRVGHHRRHHQLDQSFPVGGLARDLRQAVAGTLTAGPHNPDQVKTLAEAAQAAWWLSIWADTYDTTVDRAERPFD